MSDSGIRGNFENLYFNSEQEVVMRTFFFLCVFCLLEIINKKTDLGLAWKFSQNRGKEVVVKIRIQIKLFRKRSCRFGWYWLISDVNFNGVFISVVLFVHFLFPVLLTLNYITKKYCNFINDVSNLVRIIWFYFEFSPENLP